MTAENIRMCDTCDRPTNEHVWVTHTEYEENSMVWCGIDPNDLLDETMYWVHVSFTLTRDKKPAIRIEDPCDEKFMKEISI
jgi:hypothetical protein